MASSERAGDLPDMPTPDHRDGRHDLPRHASALASVVSCDVVDNKPENGFQCAGIATASGAGQLSNGMDDVAQTA